MAEVKPLYYSTTDDLIYAVLEKLAAGKVPILVDSFHLPADTDARTVKNYPAIIGASKILVQMGGIGVDAIDAGGRYFIANTTTDVVDGLQPGDISFPGAAAVEEINVFKF